MALVSQRAYARRRGIYQAAVWKHTTIAGSPIPTHGPKKLIDVAEADGLWDVTMSPQGVGNAQARAAARSTAGVSRSDLARGARRRLGLDVQTKRLILEQRRGALISGTGQSSSASPSRGCSAIASSDGRRRSGPCSLPLLTWTQRR